MYYLKWNELNESIKIYIIQLLCISFNHTYTIEFYNKTNIRFSQKSTIIGLFIENEIVEGILIFWKCKTFIYLDKFFSVNFKKGIGSIMLIQFLEYLEKNKHIYSMKLLLRTDTKTSHFYLKTSKIIHLFTNKKYVYLGTNCKDIKMSWEYEDVYDITVESCFE